MISNDGDKVSVFTAAAPENLRKDPQQEYLKMCQLSLKLKYRKQDAILEMDFTKLISRSTPFYKYYDRLEKEICQKIALKNFEKRRTDELRSITEPSIQILQTDPTGSGSKKKKAKKNERIVTVEPLIQKSNGERLCESSYNVQKK